MAYLINLKTHNDSRGNLTVIEKTIPFQIKRVFYIYDVDDSIRGGHRHKKTFQAAVCIKGSCIINNDNNKVKQEFILDSPDKALILLPEDWHTMHSFTADAVLLVLASEHFDEDDYIFEKY